MDYLDIYQMDKQDRLLNHLDELYCQLLFLANILY